MWTRNEQKGIVFLVIIALVVIATAFIIVRYSKVDVVGNTLKDDQVVRVLYVIEDYDGGILASELLVYYPVSRRIIILNIPTNTGAIYASLNRSDAISSVYIEKGIETYVSEIGKLLDVSIPFYICFNPEQFINSVDMIGGLRIFIPDPIDAQDDSGNRFLLPSGAILLDGEKVFSYLTFSYLNLEGGESSNARSYEVFQDVLIAYFDQLSKNHSKVLHQNSFVSFSSQQRTNLVLEDFYTLVTHLSNVQTDYSIRQNITGTRYRVGDKILVFPQNSGTAIKQSLSQATNMLISASTAETSRIYVVDVQNGTTQQGLARNTGILLQNAGYEILRTTNANRNDYEKTRIIDNIGNKDVAKILGDFIRCTNIETPEVDTENNQTINADFVIILGKDFDGRYVRE